RPYRAVTGILRSLERTEFAGKYSFTRASSSSRIDGPDARRPVSSGDLLLHRKIEFSSVLTKPPALLTNAAPAAISHSCFGLRVKVASARPAETSASL